ncbi:MAG: hypothetical protein ACXVRK_04005 [Gaiellaceae bacterium]
MTSSVAIASSRVHSSDLGLLVIRIGDLQSESGVLDPLAESIWEFFRLLLPDDQIHLLRLRTVREFSEFWTTRHGAYSHIVIVGHGTSDYLPFLDANKGKLSGEALAAILACDGLKPKQVLSLACATGRATFAKPLSKNGCCTSLVAPYQPVHAAAASHFCQTYFTKLLLEGRTVKTSFDAAAAAVVGQSHFRLWQDGRIKAGKAT